MLVLALGCGSVNSAGRPADIPQPKLEAELAHEVFFGSSDTAPANIDIRVTNSAKVPITVRRVEVSSPSQTEWGLIPQSREFREIVEPGTTKTIHFPGTARTEVTRRNEPLNFRVQIYFVGPDDKFWREILNVISLVPPR